MMVMAMVTRAQSQLPLFPCSELTLSHIGVWASGEWECSVSTVRGNTSKKVEIVVLETSASYCPAERVTNNRGDFRLAASALQMAAWPLSLSPALHPLRAQVTRATHLLSSSSPEASLLVT